MSYNDNFKYDFETRKRFLNHYNFDRDFTKNFIADFERRAPTPIVENGYRRATHFDKRETNFYKQAIAQCGAQYFQIRFEAYIPGTNTKLPNYHSLWVKIDAPEGIVMNVFNEYMRLESSQKKDRERNKQTISKTPMLNGRPLYSFY